ncbi:unnamed protein product [Paramecium primaurelia]|uniref:Uncharacterized protein n=1 Tax=Paramecium primaurelia TaxID=5886 RepID=A0A8S1KR66_PARPR|nr:unnamed protein product [Paramecium primaurelia]
MQNRFAQFGQQSIIPLKATGKFGDQFFDLPQVKPFSLKLLKAKGRPNQIVQRKIDEIIPKEIQMDKPFFEVINPPNHNYMRMINSEELRPQISYYYHAPNNQQNEQVTVDQDNADLVERAIKNQHADIRKLQALQQRIILRERLQKEIKQEMQLKQQKIEQQMEEIQESKQNSNFILCRNLNSIKPQKYDSAIQQSKSQITMQSQFKDIQDSLLELQRIQELNKQKEQITKQEQEESFKKKIDSVQRYTQKNWKCSSQELRALIKQDKQKKQIQ